MQTTDKAPQHAYERAMQKVLERGSSMLAYWDSDQRCCFASKAYARWFGVDPQGLIGASIKDVLGPTLFALDELQILAALRGEEQISQRTILCPDGVQRQSLAHYLPDIVDGDVLGFVAQVTDVTSLKEAETALHAEAVDPGRPGDRLRKSEATLRQAQRLVRIGSWHWEASPDISTWSEELYRIFGRDPARLPPAYAEHGQLYTAQSWPVLQAAVAQTLVHGDPFILAWHTLASGERYVSPRFSHQRLDLAAEQAFDWETQRVLLPDGRYGVVCYFHEITARQQAERALRESEEHLRLATATTGVGIWEWDAAGGQIRWDAQMFRIFGIEPTFDGGVPAETWVDCVVMEDRARLDESLQGTVRKLGAASREFRIRRLNDGQLRTIESVETVRADAQGKVQWVVGTNLDVTAQRQMEAELNLSARRKDEFLATLAHELRNPLAPVKNSLALMKRANGDAGLLEQARATMERQVAQMVRLIDDLVDVSRITLDKLTLTLERIDLASVVHLAVETCQPHCEREGQALRVVLPPQPVHLHADQARLAQVLGNLLNNASKYTPAGGCIELIAETHGDAVVVTVRDTGIGIPADMQSRVFDLFTQIDASRNLSKGGLGIGLALAKRLTELHGGSIAVRSEGRDRGSEFVVNLPLADEDRGLAPPEVAADTMSAPPARRILVVDDNLDSAESLAALLGLDGHETRMAHDGLQAVEMAATFRPDVILLDIGLPSLDGYEACRRIRAQTWSEHIVIIAMTGWGQADDRRKSSEAGFDIHCVKPVDHAVLAQLLTCSRARIASARFS